MTTFHIVISIILALCCYEFRRGQRPEQKRIRHVAESVVLGFIFPVAILFGLSWAVALAVGEAGKKYRKIQDEEAVRKALAEKGINEQREAAQARAEKCAEELRRGGNCPYGRGCEMHPRPSVGSGQEARDGSSTGTGTDDPGTT
jgi:hypothetical protein